VFVTRIKLIAAVSAVGLGLSIAAQAAGSTADSSTGHDRPQGANAKLDILDRPAKRFRKSLDVARREAREAREDREAETSSAAAPVGTPESVGVSQSTLEAIAACESGGDPTAVSADGTYRGKYQFDYGTWASVGGSGDPAAASEAEQDYRAALLYAQSGSSPWPICGA
jgi:soluble lytic murein transglycosylase-like protein